MRIDNSPFSWQCKYKVENNRQNSRWVAGMDLPSDPVSAAGIFGFFM